MRAEKWDAKWLVYDEYEREILWANTGEEAMKLAQKMLDSYTDYGEVIPDQVMYGGIDDTGTNEKAGAAFLLSHEWPRFL